jgi:excisionase family DNA binding protein
MRQLQVTAYTETGKTPVPVAEFSAPFSGPGAADRKWSGINVLKETPALRHYPYRIEQDTTDMETASEKISYRSDEAVRASGLGRTFLYEKIASGELRSLKVGGRRLIMRTDLIEFLRSGT